MGSRIDDSESGEELADALTRLVNDPARVDSLYDLLGPFCHESRNLLNSLKMSLYLARRAEGRAESHRWNDADRYCLELEQLFDRLQMICRPVPLKYVSMSLTLLMEDRRRQWVERFESHGRALELIPPRGEAVGDYDPNYLGRALDVFVAWRADAGRVGETACLRWSTKGRFFQVEWVEKPARTHDDQFASAAYRTGRDDPLALPLLGRIVSAHGGTMKLLKPSGRHVRLAWPQAACQPR